MVFGTKNEDFQRRACLVAGGHITHTLDTITYSSMVTRDTVHVALTMAALYDLKVKAADILNAYEMEPNSETIWMILGPEFGDDAGKYAIIVRAIYSQKSTGASFIAHCTLYAGIGVSLM